MHGNQAVGAQTNGVVGHGYHSACQGTLSFVHIMGVYRCSFTVALRKATWVYDAKKKPEVTETWKAQEVKWEKHFSWGCLMQLRVPLNEHTTLYFCVGHQFIQGNLNIVILAVPYTLHYLSRSEPDYSCRKSSGFWSGMVSVSKTT